MENITETLQVIRQLLANDFEPFTGPVTNEFMQAFENHTRFDSWARDCFALKLLEPSELIIEELIIKDEPEDEITQAKTNVNRF